MGRLLRNQLINKAQDRGLQKMASRYARGRMIDIGCGDKQYEPMFKPYVSEHVGVDHVDTQHSGSKVDIFSSGYEVPVPDASFDTVLSTSVLEHMEDPEKALRECARVLRPGGNLVFLIPFMWHVHEAPRDFYRFTPIGIRYLLERTGFVVREMEPICGFWGTFGQLFTYKLHKYQLLKKLGITDRLGLAVQGCAYLLDRVDFDDEWPAIFVGAAERV